MKRYLIALAFTLPILAFAYQSPGKPNGFVNDYAGILKPETITFLNQNLTEFASINGSEISVVTITKLQDETIETYAEKLFQEWGIGKAKDDNGILLLISKEDREMRIEVGYGLEPAVTDLESSHIISDILIPAFQQGNFDAGIISAVERIKQDIEKGEPFTTTEASENNIEVGPFIYPLFFFIMILASVLGRSKSWWAGGVVGGVIAIIIGLITSLAAAVFALVFFVPIGLLFDFLVSRSYNKHKNHGGPPPWWLGGGGGGGGGGGFGGFGGGMSGGGGSSGRW